VAPLRILALAVVLLVAGDGTTARAVGYGLVGLASVAGVSAAFYAVGLSEDRARAREEGRRGQPPRP
jgi:uncharacterized membrane protein YuzA (DUF378 family)